MAEITPASSPNHAAVQAELEAERAKALADLELAEAEYRRATEGGVS